MSPAEFVRLWKAEKDWLLAAFTEPGSVSAVATKLGSLSLSPSQCVGVREVIDGVLTDTFYTLLLGLDGCASIGGRQEAYHLQDEEGNVLTGAGEIEAEAYTVFQQE
jgi:hypothetical protein